MARIFKRQRQAGKIRLDPNQTPDPSVQAMRTQALRLRLQAAAVRDRALAEAQAKVSALGLAVAQRLLQTELQQRPEAIAAVVAPLLSKLRRAEAIVLKLHPEDAKTISAAELPGVTVQADPDMARGGCQLHSDRGDLDARLEVQLDAIARALEIELQ